MSNLVKKYIFFGILFILFYSRKQKITQVFKYKNSVKELIQGTEN